MADGIRLKVLEKSMNSVFDRMNANLDKMIQLLEDNLVKRRFSAAEESKLKKEEYVAATLKVEASKSPAVETSDHELVGCWKNEEERKREKEAITSDVHDRVQICPVIKNENDNAEVFDKKEDEVKVQNIPEFMEYENVKEEPSKVEEKDLLPEYMMMMREPKLSMEVSNETWVCRSEFINVFPEKPQKAATTAAGKATKGGETILGPVKEKLPFKSPPLVGRIKFPRFDGTKPPDRSYNAERLSGSEGDANIEWEDVEKCSKLEETEEDEQRKRKIEESEKKQTSGKNVKSLYLKHGDKGFVHSEGIQKLVKNYSLLVSFPIYTWQEKRFTQEVDEDLPPVLLQYKFHGVEGFGRIQNEKGDVRTSVNEIVAIEKEGDIFAEKENHVGDSFDKNLGRRGLFGTESLENDEGKKEYLNFFDDMSQKNSVEDQDADPTNGGLLSDRDLIEKTETDKPNKDQKGTMDSSVSYATKLKSFWEHEEVREKLKMEIRKVCATGLLTNLGKSKPSQITQDLKPRQIDDKYRFEDCMGKLHKFSRSYSEGMRRFRILEYWLSQNWLFKHESRGSDAMKKYITELQGNLEIVYVGWIYLTWEFWPWQYTGFLSGCISSGKYDHGKDHRGISLDGEFISTLDLVQPDAFINLKEAPDRMIRFGYEKERCRVYYIIHRDVLEEYRAILGVEKLRREEVQGFVSDVTKNLTAHTCVFVEVELFNVKTSRKGLGGIFPGKSILYEDLNNVAIRIWQHENPKTKDQVILVPSHVDSAFDGAGNGAPTDSVMLELARGIYQHTTKGFPNSVIFLFDNGEEEGFKDVHSFMTQHRWSNTVVAINLEAKVLGGKFCTFQASLSPWIIKKKFSDAKRPTRHAAKQDLFSSGFSELATNFQAQKTTWKNVDEKIKKWIPAVNVDIRGLLTHEERRQCQQLVKPYLIKEVCFWRPPREA